MASPSADEKDAKVEANYAEVGRRTILKTKLDALVELARDAVERGDLLTAAAHVEQLRDVLLKETELEAPTKGPSVWQRLRKPEFSRDGDTLLPPLDGLPAPKIPGAAANPWPARIFA